MKQQDCVIIGGGPAGLAAALALAQRGQGSLLLERDDALGGILGQCIHDGFGVTQFQTSLTGPEYAQRYIEDLLPYVNNGLVALKTGVMVTELTDRRQVTMVSPAGLETVQARAVILAMGCRERARGAISIPGTRPAGVLTAGVAQRLMNIQNINIGKRVVILGSGDIGMIMARRMTLEGMQVLAVVEKLPYASGLARNVVQCLEDYDIPLHLSHTVIDIRGDKRLTGITIAQLDGDTPIAGSERDIECDTLVLSVGLIPENELSKQAGINLDPVTGGAVTDAFRQTSVPGIFACGNVLHVHDLVDDVSQEAEKAADGVLRYLGNELPKADIAVKPGKGVRYCLPHSVPMGTQTISMRVTEPNRNVRLVAMMNGQEIASLRQPRVHPAEMIHWEMTCTTPGELEICMEGTKA